jgi:hypothetical protein
VEVYSITTSHAGRLYLIDTPGFDDTQTSDGALLQKIASALDTFYTINNIRFSGLIYMHRITDQRVAGSSLKSLRIFEKICGVENFPYVVLVTSMWNILESQNESYLGERREQMLTTKEDFFGMMVAGGAQVMRDSGNRESALAIIKHIGQQRSRIVTALQREMAGVGKTLGETGIGVFLRKEIERSRERYDIEKKEILEALEDAIRDEDDELVSTISEQKRDIERCVERTFVDEEKLSVTKNNFADLRTEWCSNIMTEAERKKREAQAMAQHVIELEEMLNHKEKEHVREVNAIKMEAKDNEEAALRELSKQHDQEKQELLNNLSSQKAQSDVQQRELKKYMHAVPFIVKVAESIRKTTMSQLQRASTFPISSYPSGNTELRMDSKQNMKGPKLRRRKKGKQGQHDQFRKHSGADLEKSPYVTNPENNQNAHAAPEDLGDSLDYNSHVHYSSDPSANRPQSTPPVQGFPSPLSYQASSQQYPPGTSVGGPLRRYNQAQLSQKAFLESSRGPYEDSYWDFDAYHSRHGRQ